MMNPKPHPSDVAIIGMSVLLPGAKDLSAYWHNILNKVDCLKEAPADWADPYFDPDLAQAQLDSARIYTRKVGLIGDLAEFNPLEFGIPPKAVEGDPAHFLALKLAREALQDANYLARPFNPETTGIVIGRGANPNRGDTTGLQYGLVIDQTLDLLQQLHPHLEAATLDRFREALKASLPPMEIEQAPSLVSNVVTGRIANRLNLMGPNYLVDAACSSSLVAVAHAIDDLNTGRCDMMLVGGLQASMPPQIYMLFCQLHALTQGDIRPFDAAASGTLLSEGLGFLVLKRLADAQRDCDRIYAVIKGVGISSDGKAQGLLAPRSEGQVLALQRAYAQTGIDPKTISLIEAHGTGIPLGDRTELKTLTTLFGERRGNLPDCAIGSVKSMIGHCIPASGIASLAKMALSLYYKILPPTLCDRVNPELAIEQTPFYVNTETRPWIHPSDSPRRAGVNAFGFGGINAHAILEEYGNLPDPDAAVWHAPTQPTDMPVWSEWPTELLTIAAPNQQKLTEEIQKIQTLLAARPDISLADVAYTLMLEAEGSHRLAVLAKGREDAQHKLDKALAKLKTSTQTQWQLKGTIFYAEQLIDRGKTAFLFSTEGSQYPEMLADLCLYFPQVRTWFDLLDETFDRPDRPSQVIFSAPTGLTDEQQGWANEQLFAPDLATETVSTASLAVYEILKELGVPCDVMVGHSAGEHVAARAAGMANFTSRSHLKQELQRLNQVYRDLEVSQAIPTGALLSVGAVDFAVVQKLLETYPDSAHLVADNCPSQVLVFVNPEIQSAVVDFVKTAGGICTPVPFDRAYHTPLFQTGTQALRTYYQGIALGTCTIPVYSCATAAPYPSDPGAIRDLSAEQWVLPVRFRETIQNLYATGVRTFIEVGANNTLSNFVDNILQNAECLVLPTNTPRRSSLTQIQAVAGRLWVEGVALKLSTFYQYRQVNKIDWQQIELPPSPFSLRLKMLLPRMTLAPESVAELRAQLSDPAGAAVNQPVAVPNFPSPATLPDSASEMAMPLVLESALPPFSSPQLEEVPPVNGDYFSSPPVLSSQAQHHILAAHFDLMQTFLRNQAQVSTLVFQQIRAQNLLQQEGREL